MRLHCILCSNSQFGRVYLWRLGLCASRPCRVSILCKRGAEDELRRWFLRDRTANPPLVPLFEAPGVGMLSVSQIACKERSFLWRCHEWWCSWQSCDSSCWYSCQCHAGMLVPMINGVAEFHMVGSHFSCNLPTITLQYIDLNVWSPWHMASWTKSYLQRTFGNGLWASIIIIVHFEMIARSKLNILHKS